MRGGGETEGSEQEGGDRGWRGDKGRWTGCGRKTSGEETEGGGRHGQLNEGETTKGKLNVDSHPAGQNDHVCGRCTGCPSV